ncbi:MAG: dihydrodipicolinate synthase family protein [Christensenellales bacterium]|jgi:4-hydroxy-2-oxoglutarate aldolase
MERIKGVLAQITTPFKENEDVDYDAFAFNMERLNKSRVSGCAVFGHAGEGAMLSASEKLELVRIAAEYIEQDKILMACTGMESARGTIQLTNRCAKLGAGCALVTAPSICSGEGDAASVMAYYFRVAGESDIPIVICMDGFDESISAEAAARLSRHPNIAGMVDGAGAMAHTATFMRYAEPSFQIISGDFGCWYPALAMGVSALISPLAALCADEIAQVKEQFDLGNWGSAFELYQRLSPLNAAVTKTYGVAGLKHALERAGGKGGFVRNPLLSLETDKKQRINAIYDGAFQTQRDVII